MSVDKLSKRTTYYRRVGQTAGFSQASESTRLAVVKPLHSDWQSVLFAAAMAFFAVTPIDAMRPSPDLRTSGSLKILNCGDESRQLSLTATWMWQEVLVNGTDTEFTRNCELNLSFTSNGAKEFSAHIDDQPALLVKFYNFKIYPEGGNCSYDILTLEIQALNNAQRYADICEIADVGAIYIMVSEPIRFYLYVTRGQNYRTSFSVEVRLVDRCQMCRISFTNLTGDSKLTRCSSDMCVGKSSPASTACFSGSDELLAAILFHSLTGGSVMGSPMNRSCWWLWLAYLPVGMKATCGSTRCAHAALLYHFSSSASDCLSSENEPEFTRKLSSVAALKNVPLATKENLPILPVCERLVNHASTTISATLSTAIVTVPAMPANVTGDAGERGASLAAVAAGSVAGGVVVSTAAGLVIALLVVRNRRIHRCPNFGEGHAQIASASGEAYMDGAMLGTPDHSASAYKLPPNCVSAPSAAMTNCADELEIAMTDNDLYSHR